MFAALTLDETEVNEAGHALDGCEPGVFGGLFSLVCWYQCTRFGRTSTNVRLPFFAGMWPFCEEAIHRK